MIIMRGSFILKDESRVEEIFKISINDIHSNKVIITICCTEVNQEWSYCDGSDSLASAWLLYSVAQSDNNIFINGIHCSSDSPLGGYWLEKGAIKLLEERIKEHFQVEQFNCFIDRKDPFKFVETYEHLLGSKLNYVRSVGKYALSSCGQVHTIYHGAKPLISISDISNGIYLNKWRLIHVPSGFPHLDGDIIQRDYIQSYEYIMMERDWKK